MYYSLMKGNGSEMGRKSIGVLTLINTHVKMAFECKTYKKYWNFPIYNPKSIL